jgi:hypothetical protein
MRKLVVYELLLLDGVAERSDAFFCWDDAMEANLAAVIGDRQRCRDPAGGHAQHEQVAAALVPPGGAGGVAGSAATRARSIPRR